MGSEVRSNSPVSLRHRSSSRALVSAPVAVNVIGRAPPHQAHGLASIGPSAPSVSMSAIDAPRAFETADDANAFPDRDARRGADASPTRCARAWWGVIATAVPICVVFRTLGDSTVNCPRPCSHRQLPCSRPSRVLPN